VPTSFFYSLNLVEGEFSDVSCSPKCPSSCRALSARSPEEVAWFGPSFLRARYVDPARPPLFLLPVVTADTTVNGVQPIQYLPAPSLRLLLTRRGSLFIIHLWAPLCPVYTSYCNVAFEKPSEKGVLIHRSAWKVNSANFATRSNSMTWRGALRQIPTSAILKR
jgi:hypothetical protein